MAQKTLENELKELENIVARLSSEELPLEEAIALYTKGLELSQLRCVAGRCPPDSRNGKNAAGGRNQ